MRQTDIPDQQSGKAAEAAERALFQSSCLQEFTLLPTGVAPVDGLFAPKPAEGAVLPGTDPGHADAAAVVTGVTLRIGVADRLKLLLELLCLHFKLQYFGLRVLQIRLQAVFLRLHCRVLGLEQPYMLTKYRRRAVLGHQLVEKFKHSCHARLREVIYGEKAKLTPLASRDASCVLTIADKTFHTAPSIAELDDMYSKATLVRSAGRDRSDPEALRETSDSSLGAGSPEQVAPLPSLECGAKSAARSALLLHRCPHWAQGESQTLENDNTETQKGGAA